MSGKTKAAGDGGNHRGAERVSNLPPTRILGEPAPIVNHFYNLRRQAEKKMHAAKAAGNALLSEKHFRVWLAMLKGERGR